MSPANLFSLGTDHLTYRGVMFFFFRSEMFFRATRELEFFFCRAKREIFFLQNLTLGYMTKNSESDYFCFPSPKTEYFFSATLGFRIFFLGKNHNPSLQVKWSFPKEFLCRCWYNALYNILLIGRYMDSRDRTRMVQVHVVRFTTTYAIGANHHWW